MSRFQGMMEEIETKFIPQTPESEIVAALGRAFEPDYGFSKWPPYAIHDVYLDTPDLALYHRNASLRLRRKASPYKRKLGISLNFKYPPREGDDLRRGELKTILSDQEVRQVCQGIIIGESAQHAADLLTRTQYRDSAFKPQAVISTCQNFYILRRRLPSNGNSLERGPSADLLYLSFERCTMHTAPTEGLERFLRNGAFDIDPGQYIGELYEAELEMCSTERQPDVCEQLYDCARETIRESGVPRPRRSKYSAAIEAMRHVQG
jgi:hypothetical protein